MRSMLEPIETHPNQLVWNIRRRMVHLPECWVGPWSEIIQIDDIVEYDGLRFRPVTSIGTLLFPAWLRTMNMVVVDNPTAQGGFGP